MNCKDNLFCKNLDAKTRKALCAQCTKMRFNTGSEFLYKDLSQGISIVLDGVLKFSVESEQDALDPASSTPVFGLAFPGRILATENMAQVTDDHGVGDTRIEVLTNCSLALIKHSALDACIKADPSVGKHVIDSLCRLVFDASRLTSIMRTKNAYVATFRMIKLLLSHGIYLTHAQIADVLLLSKVSVSRAMGSIKEAHPDFWESYMGSRNAERYSR